MATQKIIVARSQKAIEQEYTTSAQVLNPTVEVKVDSADLTPQIRKTYGVGEINLCGSRSSQRGLTYYSPVSFANSWYGSDSEQHDEVTAPLWGENCEDVEGLIVALDLALTEATRSNEKSIARSREIKAHREAEHAAHIAEREAEKEEENRRREIFRTWAHKNGSDLLKARIAGDYKWHSLAQTEYAASMMGAEYTELSDHENRTAPDLEEITALAAEKDRLAGYEQVSLRLGFASLYDEETGEKSKASFIDAIVTCPDLTEIVVSKQVKSLN